MNEKMLSLGKKSSIIREIFEYGNKRRAEIGAENVYDFSLGNPSIPAPQKVNDVIENLIKNSDPVALHGYTSAPGDYSVRTAIANNINERFALSIAPELIYITCGAAASLTICLNAILNSGDEVIVLAPFFPEYRVFIENAGGTVKAVMCDKKNFHIDFDALEKAISPKTKAIIVNSPNNPTGAVLPKSDIEKLSSLLNDKQKEFDNEIFILADEPYRELVYGGIEVPYIPNFYDNTVVCYSYSKSLSLPGERIGYIAVSPKIDNAGDLFAAVCGAGRALGFVCAPSLLQKTVKECVDLTADISAYETNRNLIFDALTEIGYDAVSPDGAFYLFVKALEEDALSFCEKAKKYDLLLVPSDDFGIEGYIRISYCVSKEQIVKSIPAFKALFEEYK